MSVSSWTIAQSSSTACESLSKGAGSDATVPWELLILAPGYVPGDVFCKMQIRRHLNHRK